MIRHVQPVRAHSHQRDRGLTVQQAAGRRRQVPVDRVVHELVPEHHPAAGLVQKLSIERVGELPDDLGRWPAGDSGDIAKRDGIAEHRRDLQQLQRCPISSATSSTGRSAHAVSTRSTISSTNRYWMPPAARAGAPASWPASNAPTAALRGSGDRRLRPSAAATTPNGRVRSNG